MSSIESAQMSHEENTSFFSRTLHPEIELSESRAELRSYAHKKFIPAIHRAEQDDAKQARETSSAENLGKAAWILTDLALRVADLSEKKGSEE